MDFWTGIGCVVLVKSSCSKFFIVIRKGRKELKEGLLVLRSFSLVRVLVYGESLSR